MKNNPILHAHQRLRALSAISTPAKQNTKKNPLPGRLTRKSVGFTFFLSILGIGVHSTALACNTPPWQQWNKLSIKEENALCGNPEWNQMQVLEADQAHSLEGYADKDSANLTEKINLFVNSFDKQAYDTCLSSNPQQACVKQTKYPKHIITVYRLGWYGGDGARKMTKPITRDSKVQTIPDPDQFGMIEANWTSPYSLFIPATWLSGIYVATIVGADKYGNPVGATGEGQYIPFIVQDRYRYSDYLFQVSTTSWQAYNAWGGKSLYGFNSTNGIPARKVSFNRPYDTNGGLAALVTWDVNMLYYLESTGKNVTYQSNTDTHAETNNLMNHKAVLSVGHDEYWSKAMRDSFDNARDRGINLGFFGANMAYWQIRFEDAKPAPSGPCSLKYQFNPKTWKWEWMNVCSAPAFQQNRKNRTIVGYKDFAATEDPYATDGDASNNNQITTRWRDAMINRPENELLGVMYAFGPTDLGTLDSDIVAVKNDPKIQANNSHWAYTGTGITIGSANATFPGLLGYEADRVFDNNRSPAGLEIIASSPVSTNVIDRGLPDTYVATANYNPDAPMSHATVYTKKCYAWCNNSSSTVFASGSMQWVWGLDNSLHFPELPENIYVQLTTENILARLRNAPLPSEIPGGINSIYNDINQHKNDKYWNPYSMYQPNNFFRFIGNQHWNWNYRQRFMVNESKK